MAHWKSTPSHGYLYLSKSEQARMPEYMRMNRYEEDCDWALAYVVLPEIAYQPHIMKDAAHSPEHDIEAAHRTARMGYPELYQEFTGIDTTHDTTGIISYLLGNQHEDGREFILRSHPQWINYTMKHPELAIKIWDKWVMAVDKANTPKRPGLLKRILTRRSVQVQ